MSGKAPPRAPRALLNSLAGSAVASSSATVPSASTSTRIGAAPPTGPRSLVNGNVPAGPSALRGGRGKPYVNGYGGIPTGPAAATPPTGPSPRYSQKGKQVETGWSQPGGQQGAQVNGVGPSRPTAAPQGEGTALSARAQTISFRLRPSQPTAPKIDPPQPPSSPRSARHFFPPQPSSVPPPPPPPSSTPPPPPPPSSEPPPPPPPTSEPPPPPPPSFAPPPTPPPPLPPTSEPPPPPPPCVAAPPLPPSPVMQPSPPTSVPPPTPLELTPRLPPTAPRGLHFSPPAEPCSRPPPLPTAPRAHASPTSSAPPAPPPRPPSPQKFSLPSPPPWPPAQSEFPEGKNYRVLFDHAIDKDRDGQIRLLIEKLRELGADQGKEPRVKGKGKGKEVLLRYEGEVIPGEHEAVLRDPRKEAKVRRLPTLRPARTEFVVAKYEYDTNSTGPPPPTSVLILGVSPLTANHHLRRHFQAHGTIASFEPQIDKANGGALGIVFIKYSSHEEAQRCVEKEHGKRLALGIGGGDGEEIKVVFDGEGKKLKAVMAELDERRRQEREEKKRKEKEKLKEANSVLAKSTPSTSASQTPAQGVNPWRNNLLRQPQQGLRAPPHAHLPMRPQGSHSLSNSPMPHGASPHPNGNVNGPRGLPTAPARVRRPPAALVRARIMSSKAAPPTGHIRPPMHYPQSFSAVPSHPRGLRSELLLEDRDVPSPFPPSRSPSPIARRPGQSLRNARLKEHEAVLEELAKNGFEHVTIEGHGAQLSGAIREEDVRQFFVGFKLDKILRDSSGWFVTFQTGDSARRAAMVLSSGARTLAHHSVHVSVHAPPALPSSAVKVRWDDAELVEQAEKIILKDLWAMLEKDVMDRVVGSEVRRLVSDDKAKRVSKISGILEERIDGHNVEVPDATEPKPYDRVGLKGLSFRKQKKRIREETKAVTPPAMAVEHEIPEEAEIERPKKKPKKSIPKKVVEVEDIESEDEDDMVAAVVAANDSSRKRAMSEVSEVEEPVKKKAKTQLDDDKEPILSVQMKKAKKPSKKSTKAIVEEVVHKVLPDELDFEVPVVAQVRVTPGYESSLSPPISPMLIPKISVHLAPPLDPIAEGICQDDEDLYFAKLALSRMLFGEAPTPRPSSPGLGVPPPLREHKTGSARTEGYYKISHAEKSAYVAQYASRTQVDEVTPEIEAPQPTITSSRSNRANARRRAQGLEEMNQVQRAMALSKGESATTDSVKFNQLQTRKKHLRFARSPIHDWGLYAMEKISRGEMVIEYVGEVIRAQVADKREKAYERQGIGSSYLFRIDEDLVVDATKKGNLGRLINHSCDPNCTAKIITINGEKKIVIYAKQDIELGSEITYDYHFPIEQDKIPCLCGSAKCRGTLN